MTTKKRSKSSAAVVQQPTMTLAELADHPELLRIAHSYRVARNERRRQAEVEQALLRKAQNALQEYRRNGKG